MDWIHKIFRLGYSLIPLLFAACGFCLIVFAAMELWRAVGPGNGLPMRNRFNAILEAIGLLTIAVASLELGQTIVEEEVQRESHMSTPTRVRRFLSRFMIVIVVSLSIEFLVAVFVLVHEDPTRLPDAAAIGVGAAALLAAWGLFIRFNKSAEELEPEAMEKVKREDRQVEQEK
ncbi:MAG TPA: hypothetical protein VNO70_01080 [Blastocatellia bacterium]|nr:hypothetical protein [Blastocatellia bacterium]